MTELLYGRHPVLETLRAGKRVVHRISVAAHAQDKGSLKELLDLAKAKNIPIDQQPKKSLDQVAANHQGVIALVNLYSYVDLDRIIEFDDPGSAMVLLLDVLQDPQNFGTLLRTAEAIGVHGIVLPHKGSPGITPAVVKASAGASEHMLIAKDNLVRSIKLLKERGFWALGLENTAEAITLDEVDVTSPLAVVVGGENKGIRRLVRESCDYLVRLPMVGHISSLNAAVAGSIALYSIWARKGYPATGSSGA
jgi:23S rRNA (guanosine2251-2'-O)-methyltransferase